MPLSPNSPPNPDALGIVIHPHAVLRKTAAPIQEFTPELRRIVAAMQRVMQTEEGIGLAAPQVGLSIRMFITHVPEDRNFENEEGKRPSDGLVDQPAQPALATWNEQLEAYVNPVITKMTGPIERFEEGCLSLPGIRGDVLRPPVVTMRYQTLDGETKEQTAAGLLARCWQHELDHLDGILIIDRMLEGHLAKNRRAIRELESNSG